MNKKLIIFACMLIAITTACIAQFRAVTWKQLSHFQGRVWSVTFSPTGKYFATSSAETRLTIFSEKWQVLWQADDFIKEVSAIDFSPDEQYLAIPKYKTETDVGLIDLKDFQVYHILSGHTDWVTCVDFSPDGSIIATGSDDASVRTWKKIGPSFVFHQLIEDLKFSVSNLVFSKNSDFLAICGKNTICLYQKQYDQYHPYQTIKIDTRFVNGLAFSPINNKLAVGTYNGSILIYKDNGRQFLLHQSLNGHKKMVHSIDFTPDGQYMATGSWDSQICFWKQSQSMFALVNAVSAHKKQVYDIAFHPNGHMLASGSEDNTVLIWRLKY